ncbi:dihydropteroate synthase [Mangrovactinospora gilvigrisea]|uniref:Dihydropteroate synthase n=1 Tax=Mangrovactinospora gilvigrisea TaxID=1428644 RepID=A0A1J7CBU0_9ACTN|nr:dihydropteroate synthase [Mangrovactinospora gilvigrisea]OIV38980.1 dihydropteroate synthase [Mangrovactinospora gilvigrisea]
MRAHPVPDAAVTPRRAPLGLPALDRTAVMGVVNVTPDSFSDGGRWFDADTAIAHGRALAAQGADILDVGGESTRPGAERVPEDEELRRVLPVVRQLAADGAVVSVDTMRARVAEEAVRAGARVVNDVSGGLADPDMVQAVAALEVPFVVMHWRGWSADMYRRAVYSDVVAEVADELRERIHAVVGQGLAPERLIVDPGLGFAKTPEHNWALLAALPELTALGVPLLVAASRKGFLGRLLTDDEGERRSPEGRDAATHALTALAARDGAWAVRVHDVPASADAVRVMAAVHTHARPERAASTTPSAPSTPTRTGAAE